MKPVIHRNVYLIYIGNMLAVVEATTYEVAYLKRYASNNNLKISLTKLNRKRMTDKLKRVTVSFGDYLANNELIFSVGRIVKREKPLNLKIIFNLMKILILIPIIVIVLLGIYSY